MRFLFILLALAYFGTLSAQINGGDDDYFPAGAYGPRSFRPQPGETYVFSAWVKDLATPQALTYTNCSCELYFDSLTIEFLPEGQIIDGWQRVSGEFIMPATTQFFGISLLSSSVSGCLFDDIRMLPFNANMKSFVYDPVSQRLMAELDENNYATFYEYDQEGGLIRVKKETERGVMTIQETRSSSVKQEN